MKETRITEIYYELEDIGKKLDKIYEDLEELYCDEMHKIGRAQYQIGSAMGCLADGAQELIDYIN